MNKDEYEPQGETAEILNRGLALVQSLPYAASARWVFYQLLQEGWYGEKSDYNGKWLKAVSRARHASWGGWEPDTLTDDTRSAIYEGDGYRTPAKWGHGLADGLRCRLVPWYEQEVYLELWFEARAMIDQFRYYTNHITLRPMGGQPSIDFKYETAHELERYARRYGRPVVVLYFGDLDAGGHCIEQVTHDDVQKWCAVPFDFIRCGLNAGDPKRYNIPENPKKPGEYQWEALNDAAAKEMIMGNVARFVRLDALTELQEREARVNAWMAPRVRVLADDVGLEML